MATNQRDAATELARSHPAEALDLARKIADPWHRAQALAWVGRYAQSVNAELALSEAREAARSADDAYKQAALLAWPLRAALETSQLRLATEILVEANLLLPKVEPLSSRASAADLLLNAVAPAELAFWKPLLLTIGACCPAEGHWRAKRLHRTVRDFLARVDGEGEAHIAEIRSLNEVFAGGSSKAATQTNNKPRQFFW